jgi:hypothetical protein
MDDCAINDEDGSETLFIGGLLTSSGGQMEVDSRAVEQPVKHLPAALF